MDRDHFLASSEATIHETYQRGVLGISGNQTGGPATSMIWLGRMRPIGLGRIQPLKDGRILDPMQLGQL